MSAAERAIVARNAYFDMIAQNSKENFHPEDVSLKGDRFLKISNLNCNQVRTRLRRIVDNKELTIKDLCKNLDVSQNSYRGFMGLSGPSKGERSDTYLSGMAYLQKREDLGIKLPTKATKKRKSDTTEDTGKPAKSARKDAVNVKKPEEEFDVSDIILEPTNGDGRGTFGTRAYKPIPVFDTCNTARRKVNEFMKRDDVTQAAFSRILAAQLPAGTGCTPASLTNFRNKNGPAEGNTSNAFYAAYIFFEKLRIKENKPKSKEREEMEERWEPHGMMTDHAYKFTVMSGDRLTVNKYGQPVLNGRPMHGM